MARRPRPPCFALRLLHSSSTWGPPPSSRLRGSLRDRISPPAGPSWSQIHRAQPQHHYWTASRTGDPVVRSSFSRGFESLETPYSILDVCITTHKAVSVLHPVEHSCSQLSARRNFRKFCRGFSVSINASRKSGFPEVLPVLRNTGKHDLSATKSWNISLMRSLRLYIKHVIVIENCIWKKIM